MPRLVVFLALAFAVATPAAAALKPGANVTMRNTFYAKPRLSAQVPHT